MNDLDTTVVSTGVGLRLPHLAEVAAAPSKDGWFEIHPENFLANSHALELLQEVAKRCPISVHTVGLSVGSVQGLDRAHMRRVKSLIDTIDPIFVSGHLAWSTHQGEYLNDLLPLPYNEETLRIVSQHIIEVQDFLGRRYVVENPSSYVGFGSSTMTEPDFLSEMVRLSGCLLLCDVSNIHLSAHNMGYDAKAYLNALPSEAIAEFHLGGFVQEPDDANPGHDILIDTHSNRVAEPVWDLYRYAVLQIGPRPTLIEWDNDVPSLETLFEEAARADEILFDCSLETDRAAVA